MSVDRVFERRKGSRKIPVEDVATLERMAGYLRDMSEAEREYGTRGTASELEAYADELDLIVKRCGGSPKEEER